MKKLLIIISLALVCEDMLAQGVFSNTKVDQIFDKLTAENLPIQTLKFRMSKDSFQGQKSFNETYFNKLNELNREKQQNIDALYFDFNNVLSASTIVDGEKLKGLVRFSNFNFNAQSNKLSFDVDAKFPTSNYSINYKTEINYNQGEAIKRNFRKFEATKMSISKGLNNADYINYIEFLEPVIGSENKKLHLLDLRQLVLPKTFFGNFNTLNPDTLYSISRNMKYGYFNTISSDNNLRSNDIIELQTQKVIKTKSGRSNIIWGKGDLFAAVDLKKNSTEITVFNILIDDGKIMKVASVNFNSDIVKTYISDDSRYLFVASNSSVIQYEITSNSLNITNEFAIPNISENSIYDFDLSSSNEFLSVIYKSSTTNEFSPLLFSIPYSTITSRRLMLPSQIAACKFSSDSKYIFIALNDGKVKMFDLDNNALASDFFYLPADIVQNKIIKFDIDYFNNLISIIDSQNSLFVFDVSNNEILLKMQNVVPSKFNDLGSFVNGLRLIRTNNGVIKI